MSFELRSYQKDACDKAMKDLEEVQKVALILPTGAGKTEIFIEIAKRFSGAKRQAVLILSHLSILTQQTYERFKKRAPDLKVGVLQASTRPGMLDEIIIGTIQTTRMKHKADWITERLIKEVGLIIVDEAHYICTESYDKALSYFPKAKIVGVTATPFRENKIMANYFDRVSYTMSLGELIEMGNLVKPKMVQMVRKSNDIEDIIAMVVSVYKQYENNKSAIVFMKTKEDARTLRNVLDAEGIRAHTITSEIRDETRQQYITEFNLGITKVLTTCDVLTAGFDSPRIEAIFLPYAIRSVTQYLQRVGRGLRTFAEGGKNDCRVYVFGTAPSISRSAYERIQNVALNQGGGIKEYPTVTETFEFNDWSRGSELYEWTSSVVEAIERMKKLKMNELAEMLNHKDFPRKFLENIKTFIDRLPDRKSSIPHGQKSCTAAQAQILIKYGFREDQIAKINKLEATQMISTIFGPKPIDERWQIKSGKHAGKHISELPYAYRNYVMKYAPTSDVARMLREWKNQGAKNERMGT